MKSVLQERKVLLIILEKGLQSLLWFLEEGENKAYLEEIIMNILGLLIKDLEYGESTIEILSRVKLLFSFYKKHYLNVIETVYQY